MNTIPREERQRRNKELEQKALKRLKDRGHPFFGAAEKDVLQMRIQIQQLIKTNNENVQHIRDLLRFKEETVEKVKESNYMVRSLMDLVVSKDVMTEKEINNRIKHRQLADLHLEELDKPVEMDDIITIKFKLIYEGKIIDDKTSQAMRYDMGSNGLPCEKELVGMKKGDTRVIQDVVFGSKFRLKDYVGKSLTMEVTLCGVHRKIAESPESTDTTIQEGAC